MHDWYYDACSGLLQLSVTLGHRESVGLYFAGTSALYSPGIVPYRKKVLATPDNELLRYEKRIRDALRELGIPESLATGRSQSMQLECEDLVSIGPDLLGREQRMERRAAVQWQAMHAAAELDRVPITPVSGFRGFDYQRDIIARKLKASQSIEQIMSVSALPGFSEHHTGRAIDVGTPGCPLLTEEFEHTEAYAWLTRRARGFGFSLSYPRGNPHGVIFEPWHWFCGEM